jgi:alpha-L-fucosidase
MDELADIYFGSVGRGQPLLLNVPVTPEGVIAQEFVDRVQEFGHAIRSSFRENLAFAAGVTASSQRGEQFRVQNLLNNRSDLYWAANDTDRDPWLQVEFPAETTFDIVAIGECIALGQRIARFACEVRFKKHWKLLHSCGTIGAKRLLRSDLVTADAIRFTFSEFYAPPVIATVGAFRASPSFALGDGFLLELTNIESHRLEKTGEWVLENENIVTSVPQSTASFAFDGTKAWIVGTLDEGYGEMNVFVDNFLVRTVPCHSAVRQTRQLLFTSEDLADCRHVVRIESASAAPISIHNLYLLQNGGVGLFEVEAPALEVPKGENLTLRILRHGGTNGVASVSFQTLPGTAIDGANFVAQKSKVTFADGENVQTVVVQTVSSRKVTGNLTFFAEIVAPSDGAVLGVKRRMLITLTELKSQAGRLAQGVTMSHKTGGSITWIAASACCILLCCFVVFAMNRKDEVGSDELTSLIHGQRLYVL